jgi:DnaJ-class molecular chaperone
MITIDTYFKVFKIKKIDDIDHIELKRRFRILVGKYHPDKKPYGNNEKFLLIHDAYEYLSERIKEYRKIESEKFFNNPDHLHYGDGSIYSISKKRWLKFKGKIIDINI